MSLAEMKIGKTHRNMLWKGFCVRSLEVTSVVSDRLSWIVVKNYPLLQVIASDGNLNLFLGLFR